MKKRIIALALVIVMLFALAACNAKPEATPAPTEKPAEKTPEPTPEPTPKPTPEPTPAATPEPTPAGIPDGSGVVTYTSKNGGFSIDFDSDKYVANELPTGNIIINAGTDEGIPYCVVSVVEKEIMGQENASDALGYLMNVAEGVQLELGEDIVHSPEQLPSIAEGRDMLGLYYSYNDEDAGGEVWNYYYAENLENGKIVVFSSSALESDRAAVYDIMQLAVNSFKLGA